MIIPYDVPGTTKRSWMVSHRSRNPDAISLIAHIGAPILVIATLLWDIASGRWQRVLGYALIFTIIVVIYFFLFSGDQDAAEDTRADDHSPPGNDPQETG